MKRLFSNAPALVGAFFVLAFSAASRADEQAAAPAAADQGQETVTDGPAVEKPALTFMAYNIKNWLVMRRYVDGERIEANKPRPERDALIGIIAAEKPDVLGICEIGSPEDMAEFAAELKAAGLDYPHVEYTHGFDKHRRLALLSRFPFANTDSQTELSYQLEGQTWLISRGILDVTVETPIGPMRFLGCHLKSKREIPEGDQAEIRHNEAILLRERVVDILDKEPSTKLVVYGDINDTRRSDAVGEIIGRRNSKTGLDIVQARDDRGCSWTHHWGYQDIYSRLDWVFTSGALRKYTRKDRSYVDFSQDWRLASDHRAIIVPFFEKRNR